MTASAVLLALGGLGAFVGTIMVAVGRRMAGYLTSRPMHSEGDALFTYCYGAGWLGLALGVTLIAMSFMVRQ